MSAWDLYRDRIEVHGATVREAAHKNEVRMLTNKLKENLSYFTVTIFDQAHGYNIMTDEMQAGAITQNVAIINSDNLNEKYIYTLPGEDIEHGSLVRWMDNYWLVTEKDANNNVYERAKMIQCNYLLRWVTGDNKIVEQWCIVEDGTKYLTGELEDRHFIVTRGDSRIYLSIARNEITTKLTRSNRFLIDDPDSPIKLSYQLTKPMKLGSFYNGKGVYKFVLQEVNSTDDDNIELGIADYYKYFPRTDGESADEPTVEPTPGGKKVWL